MPYTVKHDAVQGIVDVTFSGFITGDDLRDATTACIAFQQQTGALRFLIDADSWDMDASLVDIYDLPNRMYWEQELQRRSRIGVVLPATATAQEAAYFYETACQNHGWNAKVCSDRQTARDWLTSAVDTTGSDNAPG
jgi:hypothetical protein